MALPERAPPPREAAQAAVLRGYYYPGGVVGWLARDARVAGAERTAAEPVLQVSACALSSVT